MGEMGAGSAAGMASLSPTMIERRRTVEKGERLCGEEPLLKGR